MGRLVLLALASVGILLAVKHCGSDGEVEDAHAEDSAANVVSAGDGVEAPPDHRAPDAGAANASAEPVAPAVSPSVVDAALGRLLDGSPLGDLEADLRAATGEHGAAAELIRASSADPGERWLGWTGFYELLAADHPRYRQVRDRTLEVARQGAVSAAHALDYVVVSGDSLDRICTRMKKDHGILVTPGLVQWANGLRNDRIFPKQRLRIPRGPLLLRVSKRDFHLRAYLGDGIIREYGVGLGRDDRTPVAEFTIDTRLVKAPWPDPETGKMLHYGEPGYQIGTRWLGFVDEGPYTGFGIHGTDEPQSIGKNESMGCVRLRNPDVEALFELVPRGARVSIE